MKNAVRIAIFCLAAASLGAQPGPPGGGPPGGGGGPGGGGDGIWIRNAFYGEIQTFDTCMGHQPNFGDYHHHAQPVCLRAQLGDNVEAVKKSRTGTTYRESAGPFTHSPILGWALDGYPMYGPYGYSDPTDPTSEIRRMDSSFSIRNITARTTLPDYALSLHDGVAQELTEVQYGPPINDFFPLGRYLEDHEYTVGLGDLDQYNGRFTITPEFPDGTYAYFMTIDETGTPTFPYIIGPEYYGEVVAARANAVPASAEAFISNGITVGASENPLVNSWYNLGAGQNARVVVGYAPDTGPQTTWPTDLPSGLAANGGADAPALADVQAVSVDGENVYVNSEGLGSYDHHGPWFDPLFAGGIFGNYPSAQAYQYRFSAPTGEAEDNTASGLGPVGILVNGVPAYNMLDGGSYGAEAGDDVGGGRVQPTAVQASAASYEQGPAAPGSLMSAFALFGAKLATSTAAAETAEWPTQLGGATVTLTDSAGVDHVCRISYASPSQVNYRLAEGAGSGVGSVTISAGGVEVVGGVYVAETYPNLFQLTDQGLVAANVLRVSGATQTYEEAFSADGSGAIQPKTVEFGGDSLYLILYGSGMGLSPSEVSITVNGSEVDVLYGGPQGDFDGLDQYNIQLDSSLAGNGKTEIVVTVDGRVSNPVYVWL